MLGLRLDWKMRLGFLSLNPKFLNFCYVFKMISSAGGFFAIAGALSVLSIAQPALLIAPPVLCNVMPAFRLHCWPSYIGAM